MRRSRLGVATFVCAALVITLLVGSSGAIQGQRPLYGSLQTVAQLPVGAGDDMLGYSASEPGAETRGPEAFWILGDGTVRILDSLKDRVVDYAGNRVIRQIPLAPTW